MMFQKKNTPRRTGHLLRDGSPALLDRNNTSPQLLLYSTCLGCQSIVGVPKQHTPHLSFRYIILFFFLDDSGIFLMQPIT
jgi:hypothetical protein